MTDNKVGDVVLVSEDAAKQLNPRQKIAYREHRRQLVEWLRDLGKNPKKAVGYADSTVRTRAHRLDKFYRWVWRQEDGYTDQVTTAHADAWMKWLARQEFKESYKTCCQKAVKTLFKWQSFKTGDPVEWEPVITYSDPSTTYQPRDYLEKDERQALREAVIEYGAIPHYNSLSREERAEWKGYLAQRFGKAKSAVSKQDWEQANSFKFPSLVCTSLDAGLRPEEVGRARVAWVDVDNWMLRIPTEQSTKNRDNWRMPLRDDTTGFLRQWLNERGTRERYADSDRLWLTKEQNPYSSKSVNYHLEKLCELAGIETENRDITWYSIRHSVGKHLTDEKGLPAAGAQLRHKSTRTTQKYAHPSTDVQRDGVNRIG